MQQLVRLASLTILAVTCLVPRSGAALARPAMPAALPPAPRVIAFTVPGVSPMATLVFQSGKRAILVGRQLAGNRIVFLLYDLTGRHLVRRSVGPASLSDAVGAYQVLDEARGRAYILFSARGHNPSRPLTLISVVDLHSGRPIALATARDIALSPGPVIDPATGALWYVGIGTHGDELVHVSPAGAASGSGYQALSGDIQSVSLLIDPARRRLILVGGFDRIALLAFDLATGKPVWQMTSATQYSFSVAPLLDAAVGMIWFGDIVSSTVTLIRDTDGRQQHIVLGDAHTGLVRLFAIPGHGVFAQLTGDRGITLEQQSAHPLGHRTLATIVRRRLAYLNSQINGPPALKLIADPLMDLAAPHTVLEYALALKAGDIDLFVVPSSPLSVLDWRSGQVRSQPLGVAGGLVLNLLAPIGNGFYLTLGTGKHHLDTQTWDGTVLLVVLTEGRA